MTEREVLSSMICMYVQKDNSMIIWGNNNFAAEVCTILSNIFILNPKDTSLTSVTSKLTLILHGIMKRAKRDETQYISRNPHSGIASKIEWQFFPCWSHANAF